MNYSKVSVRGIIRTRTLSIFFEKLFVAIGAISSVITILSLSPLEPIVSSYPWYILLGIFFISLVYACYFIRVRTKIELSLSSKVKAKIFYGDLFKSENIIVIPVNDYFDTVVDNKIVSSNTLHGKFIQNVFGGNEAELKRQLKLELDKYDPLEVNSGRKSGNKKSYRLGTVCQVIHGNSEYYLVALTKFNSNNRAEVQNSEYQRVLCDLFSYVEQNSQGKEVNIPLIGAGHSGVKLDTQKLLEFLLFSISLKDDLTLINGINIILHESVKADIDLASTEILFKTIGK
ncbi:hypothetical protein BAZOLSSOX_3288 [uncultured Gammaproteobacteria bacterium]|jgi:hypothetical protein|nr:hypothetical protein BAZOLSSOX_3288 [uncultured Gammaproteobacteria bacterium]